MKCLITNFIDILDVKGRWIQTLLKKLAQKSNLVDNGLIKRKRLRN